MEKATWVFSDKATAKAAFTQAYERCGLALSYGEECKNVILEIRPESRSDQANRRLHAMLSTIARHCMFCGQKLTIDQVKLLMVSGHSVATGREAEIVIGLEGEQVNLRESTAKMSISRMNSLMTYIEAWAANNGIAI